MFIMCVRLCFKDLTFIISYNLHEDIMRWVILFPQFTGGNGNTEDNVSKITQLRCDGAGMKLEQSDS